MSEYLTLDERDYYDISCDGDYCDNVLLVYEPYLEYDEYDFKVSLHTALNVKNLEFKIGVVSEEFTEFTLAIKYLFLTITVILTIVYLIQLMRLSIVYWPIETRYILGLSISLIFFNEPL